MMRRILAELKQNYIQFYIVSFFIITNFSFLFVIEHLFLRLYLKSIHSNEEWNDIELLSINHANIKIYLWILGQKSSFVRLNIPYRLLLYYTMIFIERVRFYESTNVTVILYVNFVLFFSWKAKSIIKVSSNS